MDRAFTDEEKIRRAIEISERRNKSYLTRDTGRINVNKIKKNYKLFKKMILQIIICLLIYFIFYLISTTNYAFSENMLENTDNILNYDINLPKLYNDIQNFFVMNTNNEEKDNKNNEVNNIIVNNIQNQNTSITKENQINSSVTNNTVENIIKEEKKEEDYEKDNKQNKEEIAMKEDAAKVKKLCKFQKPLSGTITSEFGEREATIDGMTTDHKGIDIAANSGTNIKSAISGTVSVAEQNSEYGKFIKVINGDVMTVYAHCKTLKVKVGDKVKTGQTIATVGSTGNSTGPHLHFEIRLSGRYIDPKYVINF